MGKSTTGAPGVGAGNLLLSFANPKIQVGLNAKSDNEDVSEHVNIDFFIIFHNWQRVTLNMRPWWFAALALVLSVTGFSAGNVVAAEEAVRVSGLKIGLDGTFRLGCWSSIEFDLSGPAGLEITPVLRSADPDGRGTLQPLSRVTLSGDQPRHIRGLFQSGKLNAFLQLQLMEGDRVHQVVPIRVGPGRPFQALKQSTGVWLLVGSQPVFSQGLAQWQGRVTNSVHLITLDDFSQPIWSNEVLDGIDVIVLTGDVVMDVGTSDAICGWVQRGGRLIVSVGNTVPQLMDSPLATWLPALPRQQFDVAKLSGIQDLVPRSSQLRTLTTIPAAQFDRTKGVVIASGLGGPLVLRSAFGSGQITMVAVRMDEPPLSSWHPDSQSQLAGILAGVPLPWDHRKFQNERSDFDPSAVTDLQSQLSQSLDHFAGRNHAAPWSVIGWIALFAIIIGPIDYLLVQYWLKKPEWTWATMLVWIVLASGAAILRGNALNDWAATSRQIDSVDLDLTTDTIRGQSWYSYYSEFSQRQRLNVQLNRDFVSTGSAEIVVSWVPRPGEGYRGMSGSGGLNEALPQYRFFEDRSGVDNFPVQKWSTAAIVSNWQLTLPAHEFVTADLREAGLNRLTGSIRHSLPGELTDWFVAYGNFAYFDRTSLDNQTRAFPPGQAWDISQSASNLLRGRLLNMIQKEQTGQPSTTVDDHLQRMAYDPSHPSPLISELVISFYKSLGGESYTGLQNESLKRLDFSETIQLNRAVLFGRLKISPVQFQLDQQELPVEERSAMVRIVLPVKEFLRDPDAPPAKEILQPKL